MRVLALVFVIGVPLVFAFVWLRKQQQKRQAELEDSTAYCRKGI